jgi:hypothetical protein
MRIHQHYSMDIDSLPKFGETRGHDLTRHLHRAAAVESSWQVAGAA